MDVQSTVRHMIQMYPTLYRSRVMALLNLFDSYDAEWRGGDLIRLEPDDDSQSFLPYGLGELADPGDLADVSRVLFYRTENSKAQFTYDNAYLLAQDKFSHLPKSYCVRFTGKRFDDIPEDVTPDWLAAAKELAGIILIHGFKPKDGMAPLYQENEQREHDRAVKRCRQFLERFQVIRPSPFERAARIETLQREAEALGLVLVEEDGKVASEGL